MPLQPHVSLVLPTLNGAAHLRQLLPVIASQNYGGELEIVAIDSASGDDSIAILQRHGARVFSIARRDFGHGRTRNFGVQMARGEVVVFLSQDALPVGFDWLGELVAPLENKGVGATFARQLPRPNATPFERHAHAQLYPPRSRSYHLQPRRALEMGRLFFSNVCSAARREICLEFPFDETLVMSEDQFFARDLLLAGFQISYNARARVVHSHAYTLRELGKRHFDSGASLRGLAPEKAHRRARFAAQFLARELVFLARHHPLWLVRWPWYEGTRIAALLAGSQAHRLPSRLNQKLSSHPHFWNEIEDANSAKT